MKEKEMKTRIKMKRLARSLFAVLSVTLVLAACGPAPTPEVVKETVEVPVKETVEVEVEVEVPVKETVVVEQTVVVEPTEEPTPEQLTLTILHSISPDDAKAAVFDDIVAGFEAAHPNITVEQELVPDDEMAVKAETAYMGGVEQDIILMNYPHLTENWIKDGLTIDLNPYLEEWGLGGTFYASAIEGYINEDGQLPALPMEGYSWPIWYNTAILDEVGLETPTSMDELVAAAQTIRDAGYQPFSTGGSDWTGARFYMLLLSAYMSVDEVNALFQEGGYMDSPAAMEATEQFVAMRDSGFFADDVEGLEFSSMNALFFNGEAAMMHAGSWSYAEAPEDIVDDVYLGGLPLPEGSPRDNPVMFGGFGAKAVHVTRNGAENLDAVKAFVQYLFQPDVFVQFVNEAGMVAPVKDLPVDETAVPQLFADSLSLPERTELGGSADSVPGDIGDPWIAVVTDGFIPNGMTAEEILTQLDALYE
jgi:multiple sugar transport system substrate-binding protein